MDEYDCCQETGIQKGPIKLEDLHTAAVSGLGWSGLAQVLQQLAQFVVTAILAHLLSPADFGVMAMIIVVLGFLRLLNELGLSSALVYMSTVTQRHLNSVFWITFGAGIVLTLLFICLAPLISNYYEEPSLKVLSLALANIFVINSLGVVPQSLLLKKMDFRRLAAAEIPSTVLSGIIAIILAWSGAGVWSLVAQSLVAAATLTVLLWLSCRWRPALSFDRESLNELKGFGVSLLGYNIFNYWSRNFDNLLIGKFIGSSALGIYSCAYNLMVFPVFQITSVTSKVMFPALASIQNDHARVRDAFLLANRIIALVSFPVMVGLYVTSESLLLLIYGDQWREAVPVFRILCISGMFQPVGATVGWLLTSQGRTDLLFKLGIYSAAVYVISFSLGLRWGIEGVAWAYVSAGYVLIWYPAWSIPGRLVGLRFSEMLGNVGAPFWASVLMGISVWGLDQAVFSQLPHMARLMSDALVGICLYWGMIAVFRVKAYGESKRFIIDLWRLAWRGNSGEACVSRMQ